MASSMDRSCATARRPMARASGTASTPARSAAARRAARRSSVARSSAGLSNRSSSPPRARIAGTGPLDLWVFGEGSAALHYGGSWTPFPTNGAAALVGSWAIATDDVWAVGDVVAHWDGTQWSTVDGVPAATYTDVWAAGSDAVYVATKDAGVLAWDGATWQTLGSFPGGAIGALRGASATDIWAAGATMLWHWNGATWSMALVAQAFHIDVVDSGDVWIAGVIGTSASVIAYWNGASWTQWTEPNLDYYDGVAATAPNNAWVSGGNGMYHYDGTAWTVTSAVEPNGRESPSPLITFGPGSVVGLSPDGLVYRYHGQAYVEFSPGVFTATQSWWMDAGNDVFFGDNSGHIQHYDGTSWTSTAVAGVEIYSVFGTSPTNVWACDGNGNVFRYNAANQTWSASVKVAPGVVWGTGPTDMWVFGTAAAQHFDGTTWTPISAALFRSISATSLERRLGGERHGGVALGWNVVAVGGHAVDRATRRGRGDGTRSRRRGRQSVRLHLGRHELDLAADADHGRHRVDGRNDERLRGHRERDRARSVRRHALVATPASR